MPSSSKAIKEILTLIPKENKNIFELGSGFGTLAVALARKFPESQIHAFEISWVPYFFSVLLKNLFQIKNLTLHRKNFFYVSLKEADCVVCYLCPQLMKSLTRKFSEELKSSIVVTNTFAIQEWEPIKVHNLDDLWRSKIFLYRIF